MPPIFQVLKGFTAFEVMIVMIAGNRGSFWCWHNPVRAQARNLWWHVREKLEPALGTVVSACRGNFASLEFKPREYLVRKGLSP